VEVRRALRVWRRDGLAAALVRMWEITRGRLYLREDHVWYQLDVAAERPRRELPPEVRLARAGLEQAGRVEELGQSAAVARRRHAEGNALWLALDGDELLFGCWTFSRRAPVLAANGGWLELPAGIACLEDSATLPAARGRGFAPGSWTAIADRLAADGCTAMITKVGVENTASRKAVAKAGFREIGVMRLRRYGARTRATLEPTNEGLGSELCTRLGASLSRSGRRPGGV